MTISLPCYAGNKGVNETLSATQTVVTGDVLNGCYKKENGQFRLVISTDQCLPSEMPISWNLTGPAGPQGIQGPIGPQGAQGTTGPQGLPGPTGLTGMEVAYVQVNTKTLSGAYGTVDVFCESGDAVISGGCDISGNDPQWVLQKTLPLFNITTIEDPSNPKDGWSCTYNNVFGFRTPSIQIKAIVICTDLTS
jgi:hypothetical protein